MDRPELIQQVRFALSRLGDLNGHHDFERICLAFARARITINLLPATGPVSSLGDQGRDGETFWSNLPTEGAVTGVGRTTVSDESIVLACTIQVTGLKDKIRSDLVSITASGPRPNRVLFFSNQPLAVGVRHMLIAEAIESYDIALEIFDIEALAEHLADQDLFWVASSFLRIPADAAPAVPVDSQLPAWYRPDIARWRLETRTPSSFGDFNSLRDLLRVSVQMPEAKPDLGYILDLMAKLNSSPDYELSWRSKYEFVLGVYLGTNDFRSVEPQFTAMIEGVERPATDPTRLRDAAVLLAFAFGARVRGRSTVSLSQLDQWYDRLKDIIETRLVSERFPNSIALLLSAQIQMAFLPTNPPAEISAQSPDQIFNQFEYLDLFANDRMFIPAVDLRDRERGMTAMHRLLQVLPGASMFPLDRVSEIFDLLSLSLLDHPLYDEVAASLDQAVHQMGGDLIKASRAARRAMTFARADLYNQAIAEAHNAQISFWGGRNYADSVSMLLLQADLYGQLGLWSAAKHQHLAAAWAAGSHLDDTGVRAMAARGLLGAGLDDYYAGNWCIALSILVQALNYFEQHAENLADSDPDDDYQSAVQAVYNIFQVSRLCHPLNALVDDLLMDLGVSSLANLSSSSVSEGFDISADNLMELVGEIDQAGYGRPFSDLGGVRRIWWKAFGIEWAITFANKWPHAHAGERIAAALQILLVDLSGRPVEWDQSPVRIHVTAGDASGTLADGPILSDGTWKLQVFGIDELSDLDPVEQIRTTGQQTLRSVLRIVFGSTFTTEGDFRASVSAAIAEGLERKLSGVRLYDTTADVLELPGSGRVNHVADCREFDFGEAPIPRSGLHAPIGRSSLFNRSTVEADIDARYIASLRITSEILPRILADPHCEAVVRRFHEQGYLDWQLLNAIVNFLGTERIRISGVDPSISDNESRIEEIMRATGNPTDSDVSIEHLDQDTFGHCLQAAAVTSLPSYGLSLNNGKRDVSAVESMLISRFEYFAADVSHDNIFGW